jgi:hypothetical protein
MSPTSLFSDARPTRPQGPGPSPVMLNRVDGMDIPLLSYVGPRQVRFV